MTFQRANCVGCSTKPHAHGMFICAICSMLYAVQPKRNETKCSRQIAFENAQQKNLFIGLDPEPSSSASPQCILVASRLVSRLVGQCYVNLVHFFIYLFLFFVCFFLFLPHTHNTLNLLHKNPNNSTNIYGRSQQKSIQFSPVHPSLSARLFRRRYARLSRLSAASLLRVPLYPSMWIFVLLVWLHCIPKMRVADPRPDPGPR